jgi:capsular polysaccharide biosynthesis protein
LLRRSWRLLAVVVVLGALVGYLVSSQRDREYSADATILLQDPSVDAGDAGGLRADEAQRWVTSRAQLATFPGTLGRAAKALGEGATSDELRKVVSTETDADNFTLTITARADDPAMAAERANAIVVAYRDVENDQAADAAAEVEKQYQDRLENISASIDDASAKLARDPTNRLAATLLTANVQERLRLETAAAERTANARRSAVSVRDVTVATAADAASTRDPSQDAVITALVALLLAGAVVLFRGRERRDQLSRPDQATSILGAPLLVEVLRADLNRLEPSADTSASFGFIVAKLRVLVGREGGVFVIGGTTDPVATAAVADQLASAAQRSQWWSVTLVHRAGNTEQDDPGTGSARPTSSGSLVLVESPPLRRRGDFASTVLASDGVILVVEEGEPIENVHSAAEVLAMLEVPLVGHVFVHPSDSSDSSDESGSP